MQDSNTAQQYNYHQDPYSALEAISEAQKIAFAPILFQASLILRDSNILKTLEQANNGISLTELCTKIDLSEYAIQLLLDVGLSLHICYLKNDKYFLAKVGYFLLNDQMTKINMDFTQDVCYQAMFHLADALKTAKPSGLQVFNTSWQSIYPHLKELPEQAKKSWFAYDHFYSDSAFNQAFKHINQLQPKVINDIGGNTGKWAKHCTSHNPTVKVQVIDLPEQIALLKENLTDFQHADRITGMAHNILTTKQLPNNADIWWMSQFLDCFSQPQILQILQLVRQNISSDAKLCILDCFWDKQPFPAAALSLNASSLYFTCLANGNSRFYHSKAFITALEQAGFTVEQQIDNLGLAHSLLICKAT